MWKNFSTEILIRSFGQICEVEASVVLKKHAVSLAWLFQLDFLLSEGDSIMRTSHLLSQFPSGLMQIFVDELI